VNGVVYAPEDDSGSDKPFANGIAGMLEKFLEDRDGSETGYDGSDGSVDTYEDPWGGRILVEERILTEVVATVTQGILGRG